MDGSRKSAAGKKTFERLKTYEKTTTTTTTMKMK